MPTTVSIALTPPQDAAARAAIEAYLTDIVGRYYGRTATPEEMADALADAAPDDAFLEPPHGLFWLARDGDTVLGCAGCGSPATASAWSPGYGRPRPRADAASPRRC